MLTSLIVALLGGCDAQPPPTPQNTCELSVESLGGHAFVQLEVQGDKSEKPNPLARVKFEQREGELHALYTVANGLHVYDYTCTPGKREQEVKCLTEPQIARACLSLEVHAEGSCSVDALRKLEIDGDDDEMAKAVEEAKKVYAAAKDQPTFKTFKLMNNNVANPFQAQLFVKVDQKRCRIDVDDMFKTLFNGEVKTDFNPVGSNAFVSTDEPLLFEDCTEEGVLVDYAEAALPADLSTVPPVREHAVGATVHYHYVGRTGLEAKDGCTYAVSTWANWLPVAKDQAVAVEGGKVNWTTSLTWKPEDRRFVGNDPRSGPILGGFVHMKRTQTCGGKTETIDLVCNATRVIEAP